MPKKKGFPLKLESIFTSMFGIYSYHLENWMNLNSKKNSWILIMFFPSLRNCQLEDETQELPWLAMVFLYLIHFKTDFYSVKSKIGIYSLWSPEILEVAGALTHSWPSFLSSASSSIDPVGKKKKEKKVSNSNSMLSPASTCTVILEIVWDSLR